MKILNLILLTLTIQICNAQFPNVKWEYFTGAPAFGSAAAADMDNDGFYEIVFTTYTNDGRAHCLNAEDGSLKWVYDIGGCGDVAPIIYDMDQDGTLDVVVNGSCNPTIFCINGATGELIWSKASGGGDSPPSVADIDNDGKPEVLFGNFNGQILILNGEDGSPNKTIQADPFAVAVQTEPAVVDIDNDGDFEIIAASYFNNDGGLHVWAFDYETTEVVWTNTVEDPDSEFNAYHAGAVADLDGDGTLEYVIGSWNGDIRSINVEDGSDHWTVNIPESTFMAITVADIDEDGDIEIILNNNDWISLDERLWILDGMDGSVEWSYPMTFTSFRGFSISDIDGNGRLDLVSGHFMGRVRAIEPYTGLIWEVDLRDYFPNEPYPWFEADHQPLIADFDQNGTLDVFVVGGYGTYYPDALNTGKAFLIEAGNGTCPEWLMFRQDELRSGYFSAEEIEESCLVTSVENPLETYELSVYPNPSNGLVFIDYTLAEKAEVHVSIYDVLGRELYTLTDGVQSSGSHQLTWKGEETGVYYCKLEIGDRNLTRRIVIVNQ